MAKNRDSWTELWDSSSFRDLEYMGEPGKQGEKEQTGRLKKNQTSVES